MTPSIRLNTTGTNSSDRAVEVISPPMTAMAMGERKAVPSPNAAAIGSIPSPIAIVVMMIGRARLWAASIRASCRPIPFSIAMMA